MPVIFNFYPEKCCACGACAVACMDQRDIRPDQNPIRKIITYEKDKKQISLSISCLHCSDAPCIPACPVNCIYKDSKSGLTLYDNTYCISCRSCEKACPYDAITFTSNNKMEKCDGCYWRIFYDMEPACTKACPTGALICRMTGNREHSNVPILFNEYKINKTK